jgi:hypothetical protein
MGYDETIAKQPRKRLTGEENQRARYGFQLDRESYIFWETVRRYFKYATAAGGFAATAATLWKIWHGTG